jgi:hypothetical protein
MEPRRMEATSILREARLMTYSYDSPLNDWSD